MILAGDVGGTKTLLGLFTSPNGRPVGQVGLLSTKIDGVNEPALGYLIHRPFWRRGFATEAAAACRDYAFDVLGRPRAVTLIRPENVPSQGVAQELGMEAEKLTLRAGLEHLDLFRRSPATGMKPAEPTTKDCQTAGLRRLAGSHRLTWSQYSSYCLPNSRRRCGSS